MAPSQNLEISHSPLMSLESGSTAIEATRNTNVMLQENKTVNVANELTDVNVTGERIQTPMSTNEATKNVKDTAQSKKHVTVIKMEGERDEIRCQGKKKTSNANEIKANRHVVNKVRKSFKKDEQKKMLQGLNEKAKNNKEIQERLKTAEATYEGFKTPKKNHKGFQNLEEINEKFINARTKSEQGTNFKQINKGLKNATEINKQKKNFKEGTRSTKCVNVTIEKLENVNVMNHGHKGESHKSTENQHLCGRKEREENVNVMSEREENQCTTTQEKDNVNFRNLTVETANAMKKGTENMTEFKIIKESGRERFEDENSNFEPQKRNFFLCQNTEERKKEEKEIPLSTTGLRCSVANISKSGLDVKTLNPTRLDEDDKIQVEQDEKTILSGQHVQISEEKSERFETICTKIKESLSKCSSSKKKMLGGVVGKDGIEVSRKKTTDVNKSSTECVFLQHTNEIKLGKKNEKDIFSKASDTKKLITIKGMNTKKIPLSKAKRAVFFSGTNTAGMEGISYNSSETTNIRRCVNLRNVKESMINIKTEKIPSCVMTVNKNSRKKNKEHTSVLEKETFPNETKLLRKNEVVTCSELAEGASAHDVLVSQNTQPQRKRPFPSEGTAF
jgi:DNA-binding IscR family transcriptional regulator